MATFTKTTHTPDQAHAEAAGLKWLAAATPEAEKSVVKVVEVSGTTLVEQRVETVRPDPESAFEFGRILRGIHEAGAEAFGAPPEGWTGKNFIGRVEQSCTPTDNWAEFYSEQRVLPFARRARLQPEIKQLVEKACESIVKHAKTGEFDVPPARIHGDLWAGNVLFSPDGVVMIDPAAHGGHPHTDLAMLELFGTPHLVDILAGYGNPDVDFALHQLHPLAVHAMTHGAAYHRPLADAAAEVVQRYGD
ncbi:fructosamine kinase family protein [Corynebacterium stationis]|uniref:fructosamine kinase family protein n=1 Tax=Corynebacterium stationis TaxID=1705 RepID=UPI00273C9E3B|nr:fructosamine kinase family protein [Corynebacterium stationis]WLP88229.1 fructosamine kinase family protein [Corynebacterium stationis]